MSNDRETSDFIAEVKRLPLTTLRGYFGSGDFLDVTIRPRAVVVHVPRTYHPECYRVAARAILNISRPYGYVDRLEHVVFAIDDEDGGPYRVVEQVDRATIERLYRPHCHRCGAPIEERNNQ